MASLHPASTASDPPRLRITAPTWSLNGVNVFSENLVRGLCALGWDARIVLTAGWQPDAKPLPLPHDLPMDRLDTGVLATRGRRWRALRRYLERNAPCVYLPNYDVHHSAIVPTLPASVSVLGIVHSDDPQHYEHATRLGAFWDAAVAVLPEVAHGIASRAPDLVPRLRTIPYGVAVSADPPMLRTTEDRPLQIVYAGRLAEEQKRVLDLVAVAASLQRRGVPFRMLVAGDGPARGALAQAIAGAGLARQVELRGILPNAAVRRLFAESDATLLLSSYEGLPIGVLEAMAAGCIPVVTDVASGVRDLVRDGVEGFRVGVGAIEAAADRLAQLQREPSLVRRLREQAWRRVRENGYDLGTMITAYHTLATTLLNGGIDPAWRRPVGPPLPPPEESWKDILPPGLRAVAMTAKARLRRTPR